MGSRDFQIDLLEQQQDLVSVDFTTEFESGASAFDIVCSGLSRLGRIPDIILYPYLGRQIVGLDGQNDARSCYLVEVLIGADWIEPNVGLDCILADVVDAIRVREEVRWDD